MEPLNYNQIKILYMGFFMKFRYIEKVYIPDRCIVGWDEFRYEILKTGDITNFLNGE